MIRTYGRDGEIPHQKELDFPRPHYNPGKGRYLVKRTSCQEPPIPSAQLISLPETSVNYARSNYWMIQATDIDEVFSIFSSDDDQEIIVKRNGLWIEIEIYDDYRE